MVCLCKKNQGSKIHLFFSPKENNHTGPTLLTGLFGGSKEMRCRVSRGLSPGLTQSHCMHLWLLQCFLGHDNLGRHWLQFCHHGTSSHALIRKHLFIQFSQESVASVAFCSVYQSFNNTECMGYCTS